jgi:hypothetical protein
MTNKLILVNSLLQANPGFDYLQTPFAAEMNGFKLLYSLERTVTDPEVRIVIQANNRNKKNLILIDQELTMNSPGKWLV